MKTKFNTGKAIPIDQLLDGFWCQLQPMEALASVVERERGTPTPWIVDGLVSAVKNILGEFEVMEDAIRDQLDELESEEPKTTKGNGRC
ncbi:hypothetical protein BH24GEM2_BH24GEM2_16980 [soil metagenome]